MVWYPMLISIPKTLQFIVFQPFELVIGTPEQKRDENFSKNAGNVS